MNRPVIRTERLTRRFGTVVALDDVTLEVPAGSIFGLLGPNGAGKTTMIRILLGLVPPTDGSASVFGLDTRTESPAIRERTGALLEHDGLYERLTAEENLDLFGRINRVPRDDRRVRIRELLDGLSLWDRRRDIVGTWSRGMKQRLAIARALLAHPSLVFLDEPTAGLDPVAARGLRDDLARLVRQQPVTVFITTHNLAEAERLCDSVGVLSRGRLVAHGAPAQVAGPSRSFEEAFIDLVEAQCGTT